MSKYKLGYAVLSVKEDPNTHVALGVIDSNSDLVPQVLNVAVTYMKDLFSLPDEKANDLTDEDFKVLRFDYLDLRKNGFDIQILSRADVGQRKQTLQAELNSINLGLFNVDLFNFLNEPTDHEGKPFPSIFESIRKAKAPMPAYFSYDMGSEYNDNDYDRVVSGVQFYDASKNPVTIDIEVVHPDYDDLNDLDEAMKSFLVNYADELGACELESTLIPIPTTLPAGG
jgi:hypothetical protein